MKRKIFTILLLAGFLAAYCTPCVYGARLTRKQKKEAVLINVAQTSFDEKQYDTAIEYYTKALELNPENADVYAKRGNAKFLSGDFKEAVKDYTKALELDPSKENI